MRIKNYKTSQKEQLHRVNRIEGQVRGIKRMIEEQEYCIDIITQIQAAQSALAALGRNILEKHMDTCVRTALEKGEGSDGSAKLRELMDVLKRMCR